MILITAPTCLNSRPIPTLGPRNPESHPAIAAPNRPLLPFPGQAEDSETQMAKNLKLLLTESVDSLGIVGDVVTVRTGYARNFLLPRNMATTPSEEAIKAVASKRAEAERAVAQLRKDRETLVSRMNGVEISLQRSCNDMGHLYASVTQQEIATALTAAGYPGVKPRDVRLHQTIKRIDAYDVHIKFESELEATIKLWVLADRKLDLDKREEVEVDDHGNRIAKKAGEAKDAGVASEDAAAEKSDKHRDDKPRKKGKKDAGDSGPTPAAEEPKKKSTWGTAVDRGPQGGTSAHDSRPEKAEKSEKKGKGKGKK